jgi:hypothetical protein
MISGKTRVPIQTPPLARRKCRKLRKELTEELETIVHVLYVLFDVFFYVIGEDKACYPVRREQNIGARRSILKPANTSQRVWDAFIPNPKSRLLDQVREVMRFRHYSIRTEQAYIQWIKQYLFFHNKRHPKEMGAEEIRAFLPHLAVNRNVAASTQNQALNALVFPYKSVLRIEPGYFGEIERAKRPARLPTILTREEVSRLLEAIPPGTIKLMVRLLYGTGMRPGC